MSNPDITINSRKYDGSISRTWHCNLVAQQGSLLTFLGVFDQDLDHPHLGFIKKGTISHEFYWADRWYNIFRFHESDGSFRNYYCNINMPPTFNNGVLDYVDLDIDFVIWPDGRVIELDRDEYEENGEKFAFSQELKDSVENAISELKALIDRKELPE